MGEIATNSSNEKIIIKLLKKLKKIFEKSFFIININECSIIIGKTVEIHQKILLKKNYILLFEEQDKDICGGVWTHLRRQRGDFPPHLQGILLFFLFPITFQLSDVIFGESISNTYVSWYRCLLSREEQPQSSPLKVHL